MSLRLPELVLQQRAAPPTWVKVAVPIGSVLCAALLGAVFLSVTGHDPFDSYGRMLTSAFGSRFAIGETLVEATPLILTGLAVSIAFSLSIYNIGAEGQLYIGAVFSAGLVFLLGDDLSSITMIPLALVAGAVGGALFALVAGVPRAFLGTSEIVVTLMLNFVALNIVNYLIFSTASVFRDPVTFLFPSGRIIPDSGRLPFITGQVDVGILLAVAAAVLMWLVVRATRWGFELNIAGDSAATAQYIGVNIRRKILSVFLVSGALAGLAGASVVTGRLGALEPRGIVANYGYLGILVAALSRLNLLAVVPVAVFVAAMNTAGPSMQQAGVPNSIVFMLQGAVLLFAVIGEFWTRYRVTVVASGPEHAQQASR